MGRPRQWSADQLRRMKAAVEDGVLPTVLAVRFACRADTITDLAKRLGWELPADLPTQRRGGTLKPPPPKGRNPMFVRPPPTPFEPKENGCPVRVLTGAEFQKRKAELEARDRAERERAQI